MRRPRKAVNGPRPACYRNREPLEAPETPRDREASRLRRDAPNVRRLGGPFAASRPRPDFEGRPGSAGASPSVGGLGGPSRPREPRPDFEGRPGSAGASPSVAGLGGPSRPRDRGRISRGAPAPPGRLRAWGAWGAFEAPHLLGPGA